MNVFSTVRTSKQLSTIGNELQINQKICDGWLGIYEAVFRLFDLTSICSAGGMYNGWYENEYVSRNYNRMKNLQVIRHD